MNRLKFDKQVMVITALMNGNSIRATERITGCHRDTIMRLAVRLGENAEQYAREHFRNLELPKLEVDEIWTFNRKKQARLDPKEKRNPTLGDQWVYFAVDYDSRFIPAWVIGKRNVPRTVEFIERLKGSLNGVRPDISSDAWMAYPDAIDMVFGGGEHVDFGTVEKEYESEHIGPGRYAPPIVSGMRKKVHLGAPQHMCTSHVERANLTLRTFQSRFTRLSLGFSKKIEHLRASVALFFMYYDYCWVPRTTRITPAMAAKLVPNPWTVEDLVNVLSN